MMAPVPRRPATAASPPTWGPAAIIALPVVLGVVLLALWLSPAGRLRGVHWEPPAPLLPDLSSPAIANLQEAGNVADPSQFAAILERPLFSPGRRPPPPVVVPVVVPPPPPDPLEKVRILGVFAGASGTGAIAEVDGKSRRLMQGDAIGEWNLVGVAGSDVTFRNSGQTRVLSLVKPAKPTTPGPTTYVQGGVIKTPPAAPNTSSTSGADAGAAAKAASRAAGKTPAAAPAASPSPAMPTRAPGLPIPMPDGSLRMPE